MIKFTVTKGPSTFQRYLTSHDIVRYDIYPYGYSQLQIEMQYTLFVSWPSNMDS